MKSQADRIMEIEDQHERYQAMGLSEKGAACKYGHMECAVNPDKDCLDEEIAKIENEEDE